MSDKSVYAIVESQQQAEKIVSNLKAEGFANDRISVLFPDKSTSSDFAHEKRTKAPEGAVAGGVTGGVLGGALGWIAGIGALAIPGIGPFIAAGPLAAAIGGVAVGASMGGIAGALVGVGIPEIEAKRYEGKIKQGNILVSVHAKSGDEISQAKKILESHKAEDICTAGMEETDQPDEAKAGRRVNSPIGKTRSHPDRNHPTQNNPSVLASGEKAPSARTSSAAPQK